MIVKKLTKPVALRVYESLNARTVLTPSEQKELEKHERGYEGEVGLDGRVKELPFDCRVLNDLVLRDNGTTVQLDKLLLTGNILHLYEVKNYSGSYTYRDDALYGRGEFKIANPLIQPNKSNPLLHNLIRKLGYRYEVKSHVVFMDPAFYLYELPRDKPFIFAGQIPQHFEQMAKRNTFIDIRQEKLIDELHGLHVSDFRPSNLPEYEYDELKKGIYCPKCFSFEHRETRKTRICQQCGYREPATEAIKRTAEEYIALFPKDFLTKIRLFDLCGGECAEQTIQKVLAKNYIVHPHSKNSFYTKKELRI